MPNVITIFEEGISLADNSISNVISIFNDEESGIIKIYEPGPQGPRGEQGVQGAGASEPFYLVRNGFYASSGSIAVNAFISSSWLPWSSSFDLGSLNYPWKNVYVTESIQLIHSGSVFLNITKNSIQFSQSIITTSSFGFDNYILKRISSDQQIFQIQSSSVSTSINNQGVFAVPDFSYLPTAVPGAIIKSGSDYYFGI